MTCCAIRVLFRRSYSPGVAEPCMEIYRQPETLDVYTNHSNFVCVVSNGTAVLGLGNIGPAAAMPVMEGKCVLFKELGGVDAYPILVDTQDPQEIIRTVELLAAGFGGINLEDIRAPYCFEIEEALKGKLDIPVFHDDQHGTAIVVLAGLLNAVKLVKKDLQECKIVITGAGAAGLAVTKLLLGLGVKNIKVCDIDGVLYPGCPQCTYKVREEIAAATNSEGVKGKLAEVLPGADIFVGVSGPKVLTGEMVSTMARDSIIMAMANPEPEILPSEAKSGGARVIFTGRSDFPNQVNNVSAFPGVFRGALEVRARDINEEMKIAAAHAMAGLISETELTEENVIPGVLDPRVVPSIARAVAKTAIETGVARREADPEEIFRSILQRS